MQYRTLGIDLAVSAVELGCMGMSHAYDAPADKKRNDGAFSPRR